MWIKRVKHDEIMRRLEAAEHKIANMGVEWGDPWDRLKGEIAYTQRELSELKEKVGKERGTMIELRWAHYDDSGRPVLQWRTFTKVWKNEGWDITWSEWKTVPHESIKREDEHG